MPAVQLDDIGAQLHANGVRSYQAMSIPGDLRSFAYWPQVKSDALASLAAGFGGKLR